MFKFIDVVTMEVSKNDVISFQMENANRELQLAREDQSTLDVPEVGQNSNDRVTKSPEPYDLSESFYDREGYDSHCEYPGERPKSVDNIEDAGIDCTREPDWEVVKPSELPPVAEPGQYHNDRYWDERSLDRELQDKDVQQEMIQREVQDYERSAEIAEDFSRPFNNEVLDPYYRSGSHSSNPPSAGNSLDSFV